MLISSSIFKLTNGKIANKSPIILRTVVTTNQQRRRTSKFVLATADGANSSSSQHRPPSLHSTRRMKTTITTNLEQRQQQQQAEVTTKYWKLVGDTGRYQRPIFVAATKQHVGKTTVSLALMSGLMKRFDNKVGFIKPVGQQHVEVESTNLGKTIRVDKDCCLVKERFNLDHVDYENMSPVIIPRGYTKKYIDGEISYAGQLEQIEDSFGKLTQTSNIVLAEGTGHAAVGSIVDTNNAKVCSLVGADMILVANGGLGSAFDELELNRILAQHYNVRIAGVIINKVMPDKYEQTKYYMEKALLQKWGVPLLGCIPDRPFLGCPALADLERLFKSKLISGEKHKFRHYNVKDINVVTTSLSRFLENLRRKSSRTLYVCHVTRDDIILGFMNEYQRRETLSKQAGSNVEPFEAALIVCGRKDKYELSDEVKDMIHTLGEDAPVLVVKTHTNEVITQIHNHTPKLNIYDTNRVDIAIQHYEPYINFDELLRRTTSSNSSFNDPVSSGISYNDLRRL